MRRERIGFGWLVWAGVRRSGWQSLAGLLASLVAAAAIFGAATLLTGMERLLGTGLERLGADLLVVPRGSGDAVRRFLRAGTAGPLPNTIPVANWRERLTLARVTGVKGLEGWSLAAGGRGSPSGTYASVFLVRLERWASPLMSAQEVSAALPEAEVIAADQTTRHVARDLQPLVRLVTLGAGAALLTAVLISGVLASLRVVERGPELGALRAIGATRAFIATLVLAETAGVALVGGLAGVGVAALLLLRAPGALLAALSGVEWLWFAVAALLLGAAAAGLAALGPALRTAHRDPLEAARRP